MARKKRKGPSLAAYFTSVFEEKPEWLKSGTNGPIFERWAADNPGKPLTNKIKASLANTKSVLRKKHGVRSAGRRGRTGKRVRAISMNPSNTFVQNLETLELAIDDCLSTARKLDPRKMDKVIQNLRLARNEVVMQLG